MQSIIAKLFISLVNPAMIGTIVKMLLEVVRQAILSTATEWDDKTVLPFVDKLLKALDT